MKVNTAIRNDIRAVTLGSWHKECGDIRHHGRYADSTVLCKILNLVFRHTQMVQPLFCNLFTGTLFHWLLDKITRYIGKQTIYPYADFIFVLLLELSLTVDRPA